jgi:hypothetical protein
MTLLVAVAGGGWGGGRRRRRWDGASRHGEINLREEGMNLRCAKKIGIEDGKEGAGLGGKLGQRQRRQRPTQPLISTCERDNDALLKVAALAAKQQLNMNQCVTHGSLNGT